MPTHPQPFASLTPAALPAQPAPTKVGLYAALAPDWRLDEIARGETLPEALVVALARVSVVSPVIEQVEKAAEAWTEVERENVLRLFEALVDMMYGTLPDREMPPAAEFEGYEPHVWAADPPPRDEAIDWRTLGVTVLLFLGALFVGVAIGANPAPELAPFVEVLRGR